MRRSEAGIEHVTGGALSLEYLWRSALIRAPLAYDSFSFLGLLVSQHFLTLFLCCMLVISRLQIAKVFISSFGIGVEM